MKLFGLLLLSTFIACSLAKLSGYEYQQPEEIALQQNQAYAAQRTYLPPQQPHHDIYKKEFFIYSAPDEDFEDPYAAHKISSTIQKNLRVLFIRAPEQKGLEHAALQLAKQASNDKTAIYVLSKQTDVGDLANRLTAYREQFTQKPEVHFVKYRTPEDAAQAQQQIQSHYDALRGTSHTSNEGAAPVLNFASKYQPSYGSAISIAPGYNVGSSGSSISNTLGGSLYGQQDLGGINSLALGQQTAGYESSAFATQQVTSGGSSSSYGSLGSLNAFGSIGDLESLGYNANLGNNGYEVSARTANSQQAQSESVVSKLNERINAGGKLVFPNEGTPESTYLPPLKRTHK